MDAAAADGWVQHGRCMLDDSVTCKQSAHLCVIGTG
jgi:hypothetical protein